MRALAVHRDVVVLVSRVWQTTCTLVRGGDEGFAIDSPVYPDELEAAGELARQAGFDVRGLLATHADFDHLLGPLAFPGAALGVAETTAARLRAEPGAPQRELRAFDAEHYVARPRPLSLGAVQALPVPGACELGDRELGLIPADGHTPDGMAVWIPHARVLVCGDYLSPVEIPVIGAGGLDAYRATLERLAERLAQAEQVIPGHGEPLEDPAARRILDEDRAYLEALAGADPRPVLPAGRASSRQRQLHAQNLAAVAERGRP